MKTCNSKENLLQQQKFFSQECMPIKQDEFFNFYILKETGQHICEFNLKLGLGGEHVEIAQITDVHLNYCLSDDLEDEEARLTKRCRIWLADGISVTSLNKAMDIASFCDQTVITGDILDYISVGSIMLTKKHIFERNPEIICTLGGHDITKEMQTEQPDKLPLEERLKIVEDFWIHDIYYYSKTIKNKIVVVGLNNGMGRYFTHQVEDLKCEIQKARDEGKYILIFQHEPISTGNPCDTSVEPSLVVDGANAPPRDFYNGCIGAPTTTDIPTKEMYSLITENADVIKGVFCGHYHSAFYTELKATYGGEEKTQTIIPQVIAVANPYFDHAGSVTRIIIE